MAEERIDLSFSENFQTSILLGDEQLFTPYKWIGSLLRPGPQSRFAVVLDPELCERWPNLRYDMQNWPWQPGQLVDLAIFPKQRPLNEFENVQSLLQRWSSRQIDKKSFVFAIGGRRLLNQVGFAASVFGAQFVRVPSTLSAQPLETHCRVRTPQGDLQVRYRPHCEIRDVSLLKTLEVNELSSGLALILRHALAADPTLFEWLEERVEDLLQGSISARHQLIEKLLMSQLHQVSEPLGEWLAQAYLRQDYQLNYGQAVAWGILVDLKYAKMQLGLSTTLIDRVQKLLETIGINTQAAPALTIEPVSQSIEEFRRFIGGKLALPLVQAVGQCVHVGQVDFDALSSCLSAVSGSVRLHEPTI